MPSTYEKLQSLQKQLIDELCDEYHCDDISPPPECFGWDEDRLRRYFESGGHEPTPVATNTAPAPGEYEKSCLLCIGDSITELGCMLGGGSMPPGSILEQHGPGWTALLARDYGISRSLDVINRGFGGYTTRWILADLKAGLLSLPKAPKAITVMLGSNDHVKSSDPLHVPPEEYGLNLRKIVALLRDRYPCATVLLCTPPPCDGTQVYTYFTKATKMQANGSGRGEERIAPMVEAVKEVARASGARLLDVHGKLKGVGDTWRALFYDGLHFNGEGNQAMYRIVREELEAIGLEPDKLPMHRPSMLGRAYPQVYDESGRPKPRTTKMRR